MDLTKLLKEITTPVMGCTEPAAIALASSLATSAAIGSIPEWVRSGSDPIEPKPASFVPEIEMIAVRTVRSLYKNALAVGIPGTTEGGIHLAAALGPFLDPEAGLNLLKANDQHIVEKALALTSQEETVTLEVREDDQDILFIEARVLAVVDGQRHIGESIIRGSHDDVELIRRDGRSLLRKKVDISQREKDDLYELSQYTMREIVDLAESLDETGRQHILRGIELNKKASERGIADGLGLGVGTALSKLVSAGDLSDDVMIRAKRMTAGAADARMSGADVEVMSSVGSGNQGIMATLPIVAASESLKVNQDRLVRGIALSHLVTAATTGHTGLLSALCGCVVKAGLGATAGLAYLLEAPIASAITNMAGNITGEICDGAKVGCAVKICTASGAAVESALLAKQGVCIPPSNGILASAPRRIFENIGELAKSMRSVDRTIVQIMERKEIAKHHTTS